MGIDDDVPLKYILFTDSRESLLYTVSFLHSTVRTIYD
jgi:hypothetical protein